MNVVDDVSSWVCNRNTEVWRFWNGVWVWINMKMNQHT